MSFTFLNTPAVNDPTEVQKVLKVLIANQADLNSRLQSQTVSGIVNGSFENDGDSDGVPDGWTYAADHVGSGVISTDSNHGGKSYKTTAGAGDGGASLTSTEYIPITPSTVYNLRFDVKSSAVDVSNAVTLFWYKADQSASATASTAVWAEAAANPTSWATRSGSATSPADAYYCKIKMHGGVYPSNAGDTYFDDVAFVTENFHGIQNIYTADDTWVCPSNVMAVLLDGVAGGGGGGGGQDSILGTPGYGGGGGAFKRQIVAVTPGLTYTITVGAAGAAGAADAAGTDGTATTFAQGATGLLECLPGAGGGTAGGAVGAGGVASITSAILGVSGDAGSRPSGNTGGAGGGANCEPIPSAGGAGGVWGSNGSAGTGYGAGGGGGAKQKTGGAGTAGILSLVY
jgi:hypothetical protein